MIAACDRDGDAKVERYELEECVTASLAAFDPNKTGKLRYIAFGDWALRYLGDRAALPSPYEVDRDNDGEVTLADLPQLKYLERVFKETLRCFAPAPLYARQPATVSSQHPRHKNVSVWQWLHRYAFVSGIVPPPVPPHSV